MGTIYRRKNKLWIKYYRNGKAIYESSHSDKKEVAKKLLQKREGAIAKGEIPGIHLDKVTFDELAEDYLTDYRINGKKTLRDAKRNVETLKKTFEGMRIPTITTATVKGYVENRMNEGVSNATINRELSGLKRMFNLASQCTPPKVGQVPYIPMLKESNTRKGFFEHGEYLAVKDALPDYLMPVVNFAYHTGWREGEILGLTWSKVDLKLGIVRLDPGETKNKEARTIHLDGELLQEMKTLHSNRRLGCPYVFHRDGGRIQGFRKAWKTACIAAGLFDVKKDSEGNPLVVKDREGNEHTVKVHTKIFHDFRRTGVRNMVRAGVPERVAMKRSGHKTRSVFDRYNIVSEADDQEAARKIEAYLNSQAVTGDGYTYGDTQAQVVNLEGRD